MEDAAGLQALGVEGEACVVVDVAARIATALLHVGVHTFLDGADVGGVPRDPFAVIGNAIAFIVPNSTFVVHADGFVGVPLALGVHDARTGVGSVAFSASLFVAGIGGVVPDAVLA